MGILSGLKGLGLGNLENMSVFEDDAATQKSAEGVESVGAKVQEEDLILEKSFTCPVCDKTFSTKVMKNGRARLLGTDPDLRPRYEGVDAAKYDVIMCSCCGYSALSRFFPNVTPTQAKLIKEKICANIRIPQYYDQTFSYEEALERYKLALACAVVKRAKTSEKAYICMKTAWLARGFKEFYQEENRATGEIQELEQLENEYLESAFKGFSEARSSESYPMCGMDETTVDYLLAVMAIHFKKYEVASKLVSGILTNPHTNNRVKDKARDLRNQIVDALKKR